MGIDIGSFIQQFAENVLDGGISGESPLIDNPSVNSRRSLKSAELADGFLRSPLFPGWGCRVSRPTLLRSDVPTPWNALRENGNDRSLGCARAPTAKSLD
jgi:hypothetical protein